MREIKFRAWDDISNKMLYWNKLISDENSLPLKSLQGETNLRWMQFTGLHDKNGKEIYEGDIIRSTENNEVLKIGEMLPLSRHLDMLAENIGYYEGKKYHLRSVGGQYHLDDWVSNPEFYEIIGNVYENPELIK